MVLRWRNLSPTRSATQTPTPTPEAETMEKGSQKSRRLDRQASWASEPTDMQQIALRRRQTGPRGRDGAAVAAEPFVRPPQDSLLLALPMELQQLVASHLSYPDALALKHTCRSLYGWVNTGVRLKVDWLVWRRSLHLECPNDRRCDLGSDLRFCRGSVRYVF